MFVISALLEDGVLKSLEKAGVSGRFYSMVYIILFYSLGFFLSKNIIHLGKRINFYLAFLALF